MSVKFYKKIEKLEDFKSLGKLDKEDFKKSNENYSKIAIDNPFFKKALEYTTQWQQKKIKRIESTQNILNAYSEGLGVSSDILYSSLLIPEIIASFNKWLPNLLGLIPGCSSLFVSDPHTNETIHSRLLDYTAGLDIVHTQRAISISNENGYDISGFSFAGHPIISSSSVNEKGLSLAIHYKHGNFFNIEGSSIFEICYDLLLNCKDVEELKKRVKDYSSIAHWGIYACDAKGKVASIDIRGNEINFESFDLKDYDYLYFNNKKMNSDDKTNKFQPFGHLDQCKMRSDEFKKSFKRLKPQNQLDYLKTLLNINKQSKNFKLSPVTISTVQAYSVNTTNFNCYFVAGLAPKLITNQILFSDDMMNISFKTLTSDSPSTKYENGLTSLSNAQYYIDLKDYESTYFHLQMASKFFDCRSEKYIADFYFNIIEYMTNSNDKDLYYILNNFKDLYPNLPNYLQDQCLLFQFRLLRLLDESIDQNEFMKQFKNNNLKALFMREFKLNIFSIKMLKKLIYPKIEVLDIVYAY
jgi:hypothetical protein